MISFDEYARHDALGLAGLVRHGEVSPRELLEAALARLDAVNPALGAVVRDRRERARTEADNVNPAPPLAGVPFLVKDLLATLAGEPTGCGNRLLQGLPMPHDSEMVRRWRAAGLVIAGRTATPEFGLHPVTEPKLHGPARNPWDPNRTPGGSSGGSAAAVAARIVPMASGGDGGGSIRIPASCCGLFGFKPSRGMTPSGPDMGELWHGYAIEHVISRSVRDSAASLDATAGTDAGAPYAAPARPASFLTDLGRQPPRLRVAFTDRPLFGHGSVHPDASAAMRRAAALLESLGHHVEEAPPPVDAHACSLDFMTVVAAQMRATVEQAAAVAGVTPRAADFEPATWTVSLLGRALGAPAYIAAVTRLQLATRRLAPFFDTWDLLLTPTLAQPPVALGALDPSAAEQRLMAGINALGAGWLLKALNVVEPLAMKTFDFMPYTALFNVTGQPAMSVPLHWNDAGLPIGVQLAGRFGDDALLLRVAAQLEAAQPWFDRVPGGEMAGRTSS
jgi:amidase